MGNQISIEFYRKFILPCCAEHCRNTTRERGQGFKVFTVDCQRVGATTATGFITSDPTLQHSQRSRALKQHPAPCIAQLRDVASLSFRLLGDFSGLGPCTPLYLQPFESSSGQEGAEIPSRPLRVVAFQLGSLGYS